MTREEAILAHHCPEAKEQNMVYSVWEDGEICLEKGGDLFGQRNVHMIASGNPGKAWAKELFPVQNSTHGRIFCENSEKAYAFAKLILEG